MTKITPDYIHPAPETESKAERVADVLRWTFGFVPIIAGVDKFMHLLTDWSKYLAPVVTDVTQLTPAVIMSIVGVIEIMAGSLVLTSPRIGSLVVGIWLIGIAVNLVLTGQYFDIAVRDIVMAIGAFCLYTLSGPREKVKT